MFLLCAGEFTTTGISFWTATSDMSYSFMLGPANLLGSLIVFIELFL